MCVLTVDPLVGTKASASAPPYEVVAQGGADCARVNVVFGSPVTADGQRTFPNVPVIEGRWALVFRPPHAGLICGHDLKVSVSCVDDPTCAVSDLSIPLNCRVLPPHCPRVGLEVIEIGPCDARGKRNVTLRSSITDAVPDTTVYWDFGDNLPDEGLFSAPHTVNTGTEIWEKTHAYVAPGTYRAKLKIQAPSGCTDHEVTVGPLPACDAVCPTLELKIGGVGNCDSGGRRLVTIGAIVRGAAAGTLLQIDYGDGTFSEARSAVGDQTITFTAHPYAPPGPYHATLAVITPDGCTSKTIDIPELQPCGNAPAPVNPTEPSTTTGTGDPSEPEEPGNPPRMTLCRALEANWMIWLIIGIVFAVLTLCAGTEGTIIAGLAASITEGVGGTIEVIVGYITLLFLLVTIGALIGAFVVFVLWLIFCAPSDCRVWEDFLWVITWTQLIVGILIFFCPHIAIPVELVLAMASMWAQQFIASHGCRLQAPLSLPWMRD